MYDTIDFCLSIADVEGVDFLQETPCYLESETIGFHDWGGQKVVSGYVGGLKVIANRYQVKVKDGSLCKYYLGSNLKAMGRSDTHRAIEKLSETLHLPMEKATVTRIDVAQNFIMKEPVKVYLNHLGRLAYATRLEEPTGLYYCKQKEKLCFYDKVREQRTKKEEIPELYMGRNVLRYEQRFVKRLSVVFGVEKVTGALLYDEAFYSGLLDRWKGRYKEISKINDVMANFNTIKGKQQLSQIGILAYVKMCGGENAFLEQINEARATGKLTPKQAFDLRASVKNACKVKDGLVVPNEAIKELDKKVLEAVRLYK